MQRSTIWDSRQSWRRVLRSSIHPGREDGGALYEFAMALPFLSMMLVSIIFGGITFFNHIELANAVAVGARVLGTGRQQGTIACTQANTALTNAAGNLNTSQITIAPQTFVNGSTCTATLLPGDAGTVTATYPCNLPIPFTSINLCPMPGGSKSPVQGGVKLCPSSTYCISATTTVYIE
ncbi:MAG: TadE/TadG family type IV pilus assembly protein [Terriglobia bacterium]